MYEISCFTDGERSHEPPVETSTGALEATQAMVAAKQAQGAEVVRLQALLKMPDGAIVVIEAEEA